MGLTTKEISSSSFNDMISSVDRRSEYVENRAGANVRLNNFLTPYTLDDKSSILNAPCGYSNGVYPSLRPSSSTSIPLTSFTILFGQATYNGWNWNGSILSTNPATGGANFASDIFLEQTRFIITFKILSYVSGSLGYRFGGGAVNSNYFNSELIEGNTIKLQVRSDATVNNFQFLTNDFNGSLSDITFTQSPDGDFDFTRGSAATRVTKDGLIENVQILSGELVQNGDFEQIGSELVTNGDFATDSAWSKGTGWTISDGTGNASATFDNLGQTGYSFVINKTYKVTYEVKNYVNGNIRFQLTGGATLNGNTVNSNGIYTQYVKATANHTNFRFRGTNFTGSIDNASVKEVGQNWTFGTGWSMGDGKAIFDGGNNQSLSQDGIVANNKKYKLTYTISNYVQGGIKWRFGTSSNLTTVRSANGTYVEEITSTGSDFRAITDGASELSIDNVSIIQITDDTDLPRINYTDGTGSLLLEPQSTNLLPYSEDFTQWNANGDTVIESGYLAPDGSNTAYKVTGSTANLNYTSISNTTQTRTIWARTVSGTGQAHLCSWYGNTNNLFTITEQWQRFEVNGTTSSTGATSFYAVDFRGSTNLTELILWGAQLEDLSYATSYIPTNGSTVTRNADVCNNAGSSDLINSTEGVLYAEIAALANDGTIRRISLSDGGTSNRLEIFYGTIANRIDYNIYSNSSFQASGFSLLSSATDFNKIAVKYKENDFALWVNGTEASTNPSGSTPIGLNKLQLQAASGSDDFYGKVESVAVFKEALTDEELAKITSTTQQEVFYEMRDRMLQIDADYYEFVDYTTRLKKLF